MMYRHRKKNTGFTIAELLVTLTVFSILSTMTIVGHRDSSRSIMLKTLAHNIVSEIRNAQVYSVANVSRSGSFYPYGLYFSGGTTFTFFVDGNNNKQYDGGTEMVKTYTIANGNSIQKVCANMRVEGKTPATCTTVASITINFHRPYPEPIFYPVGPPYSDVEIVLQSTDGQTKTVVVGIAGQMSIE